MLEESAISRGHPAFRERANHLACDEAYWLHAVELEHRHDQGTCRCHLFLCRRASKRLMKERSHANHGVRDTLPQAINGLRDVDVALKAETSRGRGHDAFCNLGHVSIVKGPAAICGAILRLRVAKGEQAIAPFRQVGSENGGGPRFRGWR